jgi:hypothetical protein
MLSRWWRWLVLVVAAALLINSQCYALCALSAGAATTDCTSRCHHHKSHSHKTESSQTCHLPNLFETSEQRASVCKFRPVHGNDGYVLVSITEVGSAKIVAGQCLADRYELHGQTGISVFELLSTFRI